MIVALFTALLCIYLFFGFYVLSFNYKDKLNQLFFIIVTCFSLNCLGAVLNQICISNESAQFWIKPRAILYMIHSYLIVVFYFSLTRLLKLKLLTYLILFIPAAYIIILILSAPDLVHFIVRDNVRYINEFNINATKQYLHSNIVLILYLITSVIILIIGCKKTNLNKCKKQILVILFMQIISFSLIHLDNMILFHFTNILTSRIPGITLFYNLFWVFGIWISLVKYRFLAISHTIVSNDIISNIEESVILLDTDYRIITINNKTKDYIHTTKDYYNKHFSCLIAEHEEILKELEMLKKGVSSNFSCKINFINDEGDKTYMETKFKLVKDKYKDIIGYLIVANEVKELKTLKDFHKITNREANVIQSVISGRTSHEIAEELNITESTLKSHLTNIFNKLVVDNRIQLIIKLRDFNLIPDKQADKILFLK